MKYGHAFTARLEASHVGLVKSYDRVIAAIVFCVSFGFAWWKSGCNNLWGGCIKSISYKIISDNVKL
jgi:hypothetical protein